MEKIIQKRRSGKTTRLLKLASENDKLVLVVVNEKFRNVLKRLAHDAGIINFDIRRVLTYSEFICERFRGRFGYDVEYAVDEMICFIQFMLERAKMPDILGKISFANMSPEDSTINIMGINFVLDPKEYLNQTMENQNPNEESIYPVDKTVPMSYKENSDDDSLETFHKQQLVEKILEMREELHSFSNTIFAVAEAYGKSREISLAYTASQEASMSTGEVLKHLGNKYPYPESNNPENTKIEKRAQDSSKTLMQPFDFGVDETQYQKKIRIIKWLRQKVEEYKQIILGYHIRIPYPNSITDKMLILEQENVINAFTRTKQWLGMELHNLQDKQ